MSVLYQSTRGGVKGLTFEQVLLSAYAPDGGLYVPQIETMPTLASLGPWDANMTVAQVTARVIAPFTGIPPVDCERFCAAAFRTFNEGKEPSLPLVRVGGRILLETGNGPTLAFKDIGQQVVAQLLNHVLGKRGERATILVETSGDTGPAAIEGVRQCENVEIFCLYPEGRVSAVQELQMITVDSPNVHVYRTEGDTDEQAEALKVVFADAAFMRKHKVTSINSINWARVLVQSAYYVWACLQVAPSGERVDFVVPTGAVGNAVGGLIARRLGAPVGRIVCATNANDIVHRTIATGDMSMRGNLQTVSPAMDIQFAYNFERVLYFCSEADAVLVGGLMTTLEATRAVSLPPPLLATIQRVFLSCAVDDAATLRTMRQVHDESGGYLLDPHSAIGVHALDADPAVRAATAGARATVVVLTAHPAKFDEAVAQAGVARQPVARVEALRALPHKFRVLRRPADAGVSRAQKLAAWAAELKAAVEAQAELAARRRAETPPVRARL